MLAATRGKTGIRNTAFWEKACADCPILRARGPVRHYRVLCILATAGVQSSTDGHAGAVESSHACGGQISSMCGVWRLSSSCAEVAYGNSTLRAMQIACNARSQQLRRTEAAGKANGPWTTEEDDALNAGLEGQTTWSALGPLLESNKSLASRGRASLIPSLISKTNP